MPSLAHPISKPLQWMAASAVTHLMRVTQRREQEAKNKVLQEAKDKVLQEANNKGLSMTVQRV